MAAKREPIGEDADDYEISGSASEMEAFQRRLSSVDMTTLRDQLNRGAITRKWKRLLVEAEYARRTGEDPDDGADVRPSSRRRLKTERWGRWTATIIIATCCLILVYTFYQFM